MEVTNYQKELDKLLITIKEKEEREGDSAVPTLFLHSCCAPCSSYVLKYLRDFFKITVFYYNPNITEQEEYEKRAAEQKRLIAVYNAQIRSNLAAGHEISVVDGGFVPDEFFQVARPLANCREGGERCFLCYELRLRKTAVEARARKADYFCTTLSISPLKNAGKLNEIGRLLEQELGVKWLPSDFKKKDGYKQSIELSREYDLYRQNYCGCIYSRIERENAHQAETE